MKRRRAVAIRLLAALTVAALVWIWWISHGSFDDTAKVPAPPGQTNRLVSPRVAAESNQAGPTAVQVKGGKIPDLPVSSTSGPTGSPEEVRRVVPTLNYPRPVQNAFELQVALARQGLSPGSLDGVVGPQTRAALRSFQQKERLPLTGELDDATRPILWLSNAPTTTYVVTSNDLARLQPLSQTWLGKSQQTALEYETLLELVSEQGQSSPSLIRRLNPGIDWATAAAGTQLELPEVNVVSPGAPVFYLTIRLGDRVLEAWDENTNLVAHFPCSIARLVEKRPVGELHVAVIALNPNYTFDPANFPESPEAQALKTKLVLPPGPNNPVGVAWIGLDKPGYGIHGTPQPEQIGRTESHGCFRLANWNVEYLARLVKIGTAVRVEP